MVGLREGERGVGERERGRGGRGKGRGREGGRQRSGKGTETKVWNNL